MDMSTLEISTRANYLIYSYLKNHLNNNDFAEEFRKIIQQSAHKDIIIFKGLEDLLTVLKNYYSNSSTPAVSAQAEPQLASDQEAAAVAASPTDEATEANGDSVQKKKKKKKQRKSEPEAEPEPEPPAAERQEEPNGQAEAPPEVDTEDRKSSKKKKKKRQLAPEAEQLEDAAPADGAELEPTNEAVQLEGEAETPSDEAPKPKKRKKQRKTNEDFDKAVTDEQDQSQPDVKNQVAVNGKPAELAKDEQVEVEASVEINGSKGGKNKRHNEPFRRVREEEVVNKHFQDNSFDAKPGAANGWGYKANEDLKPTQGRSFRHEKTKKKRGSYKGGAIDTGVSSFKFESDSE